MSCSGRRGQTKENLDVLVLRVGLEPIQPTESGVSVCVQRTSAEQRRCRALVGVVVLDETVSG